MTDQPSNSAVAEPPPPTQRRVSPPIETPRPETPAHPDVAPPTRKRRGPLFWVILLVVGAACAFWAFHFFVHSYHYESTDNAYINAHVHQISPRVAGAVTEVLVEDNEAVKAGQPLARLDPLEYEIALHKAQANLAQSKAQESQARAAVNQTRAQVAQMRAQVAQAEAEVSRAGAQLQIAGENLGRNTRLYSADTRAIAKADVDTTKSAFATNQAVVNAAKANLEGVRTTVTATEAQVEAAEAQLDAARAGVAANEAAARDAERQLSYATLTAPVDGRIGNKNVEAGNRAQVGQALFALVQPDLWIVANFKETQLAHMRAGQRVEFTIDAIPGKEFTGKIESIAPATGAQFALLPPDNATGNFTKVVQRVPVKIVFDKESVRGFEDRVRPGLSAVIDVRVR